MRRPSAPFVGLTLILFVPSDCMNSADDVFYWLLILPGLGAIIGRLVAAAGRRRLRG